MEKVFPGLSGLENIHPLFVPFPFALLLTALLFQVLYVWKQRDDFHRAAVWLLWLGTLGALAASATGWWAAKTIPHALAAHEVMELHEFLMLSTTGLAVLLSFLTALLYGRMSARDHAMFLGALIVLAALLVVGADRGGQMVFQYGVAVERPVPVAPSPGPPPTEEGAPAAGPEADHEHNHEH